MTPQLEFLCDRYADCLIAEYDAGRAPTCYLFDPRHGGDQRANSRIMERIAGRDIPVDLADKREWA